MSDTDTLPEKLRLTNEQTLLHIRNVQMGLGYVVQDLLHRAAHHDDSKLQEPEVVGFAEMTDKLRGCTYGSPEYKQFLRDLQPTLTHHYKHNDHHPEHFLENSVWKSLEASGFPAYEVSDKGIIRKAEDKSLVPVAPTATGHERVQLIDLHGQIRYRKSHKLVAEAHTTSPHTAYLLSEVMGLPHPYWRSALTNLSYCSSAETADQWDRRLFGKWLADMPPFTCEVIQFQDGKAKYMQFDEVLNEAQIGPLTLWRAMDSGDSLPTLGFAVVNTHMLVQPKIPNLLATMSLPQLTEMTVDWAAAVLRHRDGDIIKSINMNAERFGYGEDWRNMLLLTWDQFAPRMQPKVQQ
jgi:Family of unknown function (DUF5662)